MQHLSYPYYRAEKHLVKRLTALFLFSKQTSLTGAIAGQSERVESDALLETIVRSERQLLLLIVSNTETVIERLELTKVNKRRARRLNFADRLLTERRRSRAGKNGAVV